jgi:hypothetical protein
MAVGIALGIGSGIPSGIALGIAFGIGSGIVFGIVFGIAAGIAAGIGAIALGIARAIASGIALGIVAGIVAGIAVGIAVGIAAGIAAGTAGGIAFGIAFGIAVLRAYYQPFHVWFVWPAVQARRYRSHPVAWDDLCSLPFPGLHRLLVACAELSPDAGNAEIDRLISSYPSQRMEALRARTTLIARASAAEPISLASMRSSRASRRAIRTSSGRRPRSGR